MLQIVPESWLTWNFDVLEDDRRIASIKTTLLPESGSFSIDGSSFRAYREGMISGKFLLDGESGTIACAEKPSAFLNSFNVEYSDKRYTLKKESLIGRSFVLLQGGLEVGSIRPERFLSRKAALSLPADLPMPVQVFMMWLVIILWRREANSQSAAAQV